MHLHADKDHILGLFTITFQRPYYETIIISNYLNALFNWHPKFP
jgi:hypothetical protein